MSELAKLIQKNAGTYGADSVIMLTCSVDKINEGERLCMVSPINNNIGSFPAQLMPEIDDGVLILPTVGSTVKVIFSNQNSPFVVQFSQIDRIFIVSGGSTFLVYSGGIELEGKKYGGLMQVAPSVKAWNDLQKDVNNLKTLFNTLSTTPAVTSAVGSPDAFQVLFISTMATYIASTLTLTQKADIENAKVQHGDGS